MKYILKIFYFLSAALTLASFTTNPVLKRPVSFAKYDLKAPVPYRSIESIEREKARKLKDISKLAKVYFYNAPAYPIRMYQPVEPTAPQVVVDVPESVRRAKGGESVISCAPEDEDKRRTPRRSDFFWAFKQTQADGLWTAGSTWVGGVAPVAGDQIQINHRVAPPAGTTNVAGIFVSSTGWLEYGVGTNSKIVSTGNVEVQGLWSMKPNSALIVHQLEFTGINENNFVGGGMDVLATDVGFWIMQGGRVDLQGATKTSWTNVVGSVNVGATSMVVVDATGWRIGDVIVIAPTGKAQTGAIGWNDGLNTSDDPFMSQFERRTITAITGNNISWSGGLAYNHAAVSSSIGAGTYAASSRNWTAEVANLTRNVKINGSSVTSRTHMFIRNTIHRVQNIQYVEFRYMGPRKIQPAIDDDRPALVSGRYGIHFHFGDYFSANSVVHGCSMSDIGNRGYVPHETHKIEMTNNIALDYMETAMWWDENELSHYIKWEYNLLMGARWNGGVGPGKHFSMLLNQGDGNEANFNVIVYGSNTMFHGAGSFTWEANSEGVWRFVGNLCHSSVNGLWVWQNTSLNHTIVNYDSYNNDEGISHGAYANSYQYTGGHHYRSRIFVVAASANTNGVVFKDIYVDAGGEDYCAEVLEKNAAGAPDKTNKYIQCVFKNYTVSGIVFRGGGTGGFSLPKNVDLINCDIGGNNGSEYTLNTEFEFNNGSWLRLQKPGSGTNRMFEQVSGSAVHTSGIADFAPNLYGNGINGLLGEYYDEPLLSGTPAFTRYDAIIMFDVWHPDPLVNPNGVHHLVTQAHESSPGSGILIVDDNTYSIRWTGKVEAHYTALTQFRFHANGKFRMYFDDGGGEDLILDQWATTSQNPPALTSSPISLVAGTKYNIRLEMSNLSSGEQGAVLTWKTPQMSDFQLVPQSQLFEPSTNNPPTANAGPNQIVTLPDNDVQLTAAGSGDVDGTISYAWSVFSGPNTPTFNDNTLRDPIATGLIQGTYVFRVTVTDNLLATATDDVTITVNAANVLPTVNAGPDQTIQLPVSSAALNSNGGADSDGSISDVTWTQTSGPNTAVISNDDIDDPTVSGLIEGVYVFTITVTDNVGGIGSDQVQITVNPAVVNQAPIAYAGPDQNVKIFSDKIQLSGSAYDPDGLIIQQGWSLVSGPNTPTFTGQAALECEVTNVISGTYVFRLTVKDNGTEDGLTDTDDVQVTVLVLGGKMYIITSPPIKARLN